MIEEFGWYVLLIIPGFIFLQIKDHHLRREKIPQFEKTLEIVLWSAIIWIIAFSIHSVPCIGKIESTNKIIEILRSEKNLRVELFNNLTLASIFFMTVCFWTFIFANIYGMARKNRFIAAIFKFIFDTNWYPRISFQFFKENMNKPIEVKGKDFWYMGVLYQAPETLEDDHFIISDVYKMYKVRNKIKLDKLSGVDNILIKFDEILDIKSYNIKNTQKQ